MSRTFTGHKWLTAAAVLAALTLFWVVSHGTTPAQAQTSTSPFVRAFNFGPVMVGPDQAFSVFYSNLFGSRPYAVRARFYNASTGALLRQQDDVAAPGFGVVLTPVPPCPQCANPLALASAVVPVVGTLELADPRPTPLVSLQIFGAGGVVALADPRPTPLADPRPTP